MHIIIIRLRNNVKHETNTRAYQAWQTKEVYSTVSFEYLLLSFVYRFSKQLSKRSDFFRKKLSPEFFFQVSGTYNQITLYYCEIAKKFLYVCEKLLVVDVLFVDCRSKQECTTKHAKRARLNSDFNYNRLCDNNGSYPYRTLYVYCQCEL